MANQGAISLGSEVSALPGVGPAYVSKLDRLGIRSVEDLLRYFPRRHDDLTAVQTVEELQRFGGLTSGQAVTVQAEILGVASQRTRHRRTLVKAQIGNEKGFIEAVWFNQPYLAKQLKPGDVYIFSGKVKTGFGRPSLQSPAFEPLATEQTHTARLVPVYPETEGLSSKWLRSKLKPLLPLADQLPDDLPPELRQSEQLLPVAEAVRQIHFPDSAEAAAAARYRFDFEQLLLMQLLTLRSRQGWREQATAPEIAYDPVITKRFVGSLPWPLTDDQRRAAHEILTDLSGSAPMLRLLEGDVGSGKTAVAAIAAYQTVAAGWQVAVMAPTEVLARQHQRTLAEWLEPHGVEVGLLLGSQKASEKKAVTERIAAGQLPVTVGTHALIQETVDWHRLGLAVVDEQHRFGVAQRNALRSAHTPHLLTMTATPIPRSLALVAFGDQDLSVLEEVPAGRQPVETRLIAAGEREAAFGLVREQLDAGRQAFLVYPVIEESRSGLKSAVEEYERLASGPLADYSVGLLHGRLKADEKESVMGDFKSGRLQALVSTSVIEVGVDVPNATVMVIEEAQQFGLAQLHQFRGRVGRGADQSYCLLFSGSELAEENERLTALTQHTSGFKLAEIDLRLRGPGDLLGTKQSGFDVSVAALSDPKLIKHARDVASRILQQDPELTGHTALRDRLAATAAA